MGNRGAQQHDNPGKARQDGGYQRALRLNAFPSLGKHQRAADQKRGNPDAAHVVQCHGGGQRQVGNSVKPGRQCHHAHHAAPDVHGQHGGGQRDAARPGKSSHEHHPDHAPVKHQFGVVEVFRRKLDAHRHGGEDEGRQDHPEGLHGVFLAGFWLFRAVLGVFYGSKPMDMCASSY